MLELEAAGNGIRSVLWDVTVVALVVGMVVVAVVGGYWAGRKWWTEWYMTQRLIDREAERRAEWEPPECACEACGGSLDGDATDPLCAVCRDEACEACDVCGGCGYLRGTVDGMGLPVVMRCDTCKQFASDEDARKYGAGDRLGDG